ncbi:MAG: ATP cone domain-containing protein, partial [Oscillospiraceae bacterium]
MIRSVIKRDGRVVLYDEAKIAAAILKAMEAAREGNATDAARVANEVAASLESEGDEQVPA